MDFVATLWACEDDDCQQSAAHVTHHDARAIANSQDGCEVPDDHEDGSFAKAQLVRRQTSCFNGIEEFHRVMLLACIASLD